MSLAFASGRAVAHLRYESPATPERVMTTRLPSMPESQRHASETEAGRTDNGPYASPATIVTPRALDAVLIDAIRATVGPYVPESARPRRANESIGSVSSIPAGGAGARRPDLPWIETFLDDASSAPSPALPANEPASLQGSGTDVSDVTDAWPLDEAGVAMQELSGDLNPREPKSSAGSGATNPAYASGLEDVAPTASTPPLAMWSDDDVMDIMPVRAHRSSTPDSSEQWAASARREADRSGTHESAALALESLARRVREGEIPLPGYSREMGDAAALAAALAALLSVRR